jgi:hypothetical protein
VLRYDLSDLEDVDDRATTSGFVVDAPAARRAPPTDG